MASIPGLLKVAGLILLGSALLIGVASAAVYFVSNSKLNQIVPAPRVPVAVPTDITAIRRGQHLASAVAACVVCHGSNLAGRIVDDDPRLARIVAPNLTRGRGGVGATLTDADVVRAIRQGVDPSGRLLLVMPSDDYNHLSDADVGAMVAYIRSLPPIPTALPPSEVRPLGRLLFSIGQLPLQPAVAIDQGAPRPAPPASGISAEYGQYLANAAGCPTCHGSGYAGGAQPNAPGDAVLAANITPAAIGDWSEADFMKLMRTGTRPDGRSVDPSMPWPYYAQMSDDELRAVWRLLQVLPGRPTGSG